MSSLIIKKPNLWLIEGDLTFKTISQIEFIASKKRDAWQQDISIDFSQLSVIDSAGIAWILENITVAKQANITLKLVNLHSTQAQTLASIQGVDTLITPYLDNQHNWNKDDRE